MDYRKLGRSDIMVSALCLGTMTYGAQTSEADAHAQMDLAQEAGITFFDCAENYPAPVQAQTQGRSEAIVGSWIRKRGNRDELVIGTKVVGPGDAPHIRGGTSRLDAKNITAAADASLKRLGVDHIDLYQVHWPERKISTARRRRFSVLADDDATVPIEETLDALDALVKAGKVRQIGVSNETAWGIMRYVSAAERAGMARIASVQNLYNLLHRRFELTLAEVAVREQVGLLAYSPLSMGLLTGKYRGEPPADTRAALFPDFERRFGADPIRTAVDAYVDIADAHGLDPAQMALAFVRQQPFTTSVIVAASRVDQLRRNLGASDIILPREVIKAIDAIHDRLPDPVA